MTEEFEGDADEWAAEVLDRIRLHRRRDVSGLLSMLDDDLADCLDCLAVAPLLLVEHEHQTRTDDYERRRLEKLKRYEPDWKRMERI